MLRKYISKIYHRYFYSTALGYRFRRKFKNEDLAELKPFSKNAVISDLFVWRAGEEWTTAFQLFNISSFLFPEENPEEDCEIHFFNDKGVFIKKIDISLNPFELKNIDFSSMQWIKGDVGTFTVFHFSKIIKKIYEKGSHLTERGYISYKRKGQIFNNYCHGNLQAVSKQLNGPIKNVAGTSPQELTYYPQMIFSDCTKFELIYANPTSSVQTIRVDCIDRDHKKIKEISEKISPFGVHIMTMDNPNGMIHTIQNHAHIIMWRPIVIKFYESYFDVLHG